MKKIKIICRELKNENKGKYVRRYGYDVISESGKRKHFPPTMESREAAEKAALERYPDAEIVE